jgi:hypothetical protein
MWERGERKQVLDGRREKIGEKYWIKVEGGQDRWKRCGKGGTEWKKKGRG